MAFQKVAAQRKYFKYRECTPGQVLVDDGEYLKTEDGKFGAQHIFRQRDGQIICLNSAGHLDWLLENHANVGDRVNIIYESETELTKGQFAGKTAHRFEMEVDAAPKAMVTADIKPKTNAQPIDLLDSDDITL